MLKYPIPLLPPNENSAVLPLIEECHEPLVSLAGLTDKIQVHPYYYQLGYPHALSGCFVRKGVADRLIKTAEDLPVGYYLHVFDGWRPLEVQQSIYDDFKTQLHNQGYTEGDELDQELSKYVAKPVYRPEKPLGHLSGGAIDLTIGGPDGLLDMGTDFD
ncbi:M15 family metallopeptidase, partial [Brevibacillus sp. SYSU BS000544]|uniref:M15 family metallopeptidase n=1 Tax=Brevibacillus sp. SYSU BS000544 TaxID=3416443 RepID=UPI003CE4A61F